MERNQMLTSGLRMRDVEVFPSTLPDPLGYFCQAFKNRVRKFLECAEKKVVRTWKEVEI